MTEDDISLHRETMTIEGDRNLYNYTFTDQNGRLLKPEHSLKAPKEPEGNLTPTEGEPRKG